MKTTLESIGNRTDHMKERISELTKGNLEMTQVEEERELRFFLNERTLQVLSDPIRKGNKNIMGTP